MGRSREKIQAAESQSPERKLTIPFPSVRLRQATPKNNTCCAKYITRDTKSLKRAAVTLTPTKLNPLKRCSHLQATKRKWTSEGATHLGLATVFPSHKKMSFSLTQPLRICLPLKGCPLSAYHYFAPLPILRLPNLLLQYDKKTKKPIRRKM